ncbi:triacylglycerol lipase [Dacryopinax primogenitus]|uniref:Carboxylic ester hydrolase n=1 Tax=Dacryopinax primogenitus (strain DJM 731) TaxID=1858805 RepID=M5GG33_DACPD|nr:triacylglycerol lipase [Dacryopinax primogenitus]EJU04788.1 triacylglycerol lipase [Dacryopinax primogenitus]
MLTRLSSLLLSIAILPLVDAVDPLVNLGYSQYRGVTRETGVTEWLGIRYAAPPLGELRWRAPTAPIQNNTFIDADTHGPICLPTPGTNNTGASEDCLYLEVWAPSTTTTESKLPVYLFIQGGGFNVLSSANYNATGLIQASETNIVVVSFNYRVGLYAFLASQEIVDNGSTNVGLLDQRMVMEWVQQYICLFGGDPSHVVLGGDSAGSASILLHMMAYGGRDDGLFQAGIAESATFGNMLNVSQSQYQYDTVIERVGCGYDKVQDTLGCLRGLNASFLQENNINIPYSNIGAGANAPIYMYQPTLDGDFITDYTYKLLQQENFVKIPIIFGDDTNGGTVFTPHNTSTYAEMDEFMLEQWNALTPSQLETMNSLYPPADIYPDSGGLWRTIANANGEMRIMCGSMAVGSALSVYGDAGSWVYRYNVMDPIQMSQGLGVPHTIELVAIWGPENLIWGPYGVVAGTPPASYFPGGVNAAAVPMMQAYWTSFIRSYDPNTYRLPGTPEWGQWTVWGKQRIVLQTNATVTEVVDYGQHSRCAWLEAIGLLTQQ